MKHWLNYFFARARLASLIWCLTPEEVSRVIKIGEGDWWKGLYWGK